MTLVVTVTGRDSPGVTATLMDVLAAHRTAVLDVEQVVVHGRLLLGLELDPDPVTAEPSVVAALRAAALPLGVDVEVVSVDPSLPAATTPGPPLPGAPLPATAARQATAAPAPAGPLRHHVVVLGRTLPPAPLAAVARRLAGCGANIERVVRLSTWPAQSYELLVSGGATDRLRRELGQEAAEQGVDVAVEPASLYRRARRLVVLDVDSTLVQGEVIEMLAAEAGCEDRVEKVTAAAMAGELDFEASLRARVQLLAGLPLTAVHRVRDGVRLAPGARTLVRTLHRLGYAVGVVSGGFTVVTDALAADLALEHSAANALEVADGALTGGLVGPVLDRAGKAAALRDWAGEQGLAMEQTVAIGDGANDLDMIQAAGLGVAFNAKPVVRDAADAAVSVPFLDAVLFLLGISEEEVRAADASDA